MRDALRQTTYVRRRLWLVVTMTVLGAVVGFLWGQQVGIRQSKATMLKLLETRLNEPLSSRQLPL